MRYWIINVGLFALMLPGLSLRAEFTQQINLVEIDGIVHSFGDRLEIKGIITSSDSWDSGTAVLETRIINNVAVRDTIVCHLFSSKSTTWEHLRQLTPKSYFRVIGTLTDASSGGLPKRLAIVVDRIEVIEPFTLQIKYFIDRANQFEGTAEASGKLRYQNELIKLEGLNEWPESVIGKRVRVDGIVRRITDQWRIESPAWGLLELQDQINKNVLLEGLLRSLNGHWWFEYRGERLYLASPAGRVRSFPIHDFRCHVRVSGKLLRQLRPALDQISLRSDRDLVPCFVLRGATVEYLEGKTSWEERFGTLYPTYHVMRDGLPELLAEPALRRNAVHGDTKARLYAYRNHEAISMILQNATDETWDLISNRMSDKTLNLTVRLLYASILAAVNDERGRAFLKMQLDTSDSEKFADVVYCLGRFPTLLPPNSAIKTETAWSEQLMIELMRVRPFVNVQGHKDQLKTSWHADRTVLYSDIPEVLIRRNTKTANKALVAYVLGRGEEKSKVIEEWFRSDCLVPVEIVLQLEKESAGLNHEGAGWVARKERMDILHQLLKHKHPAVGSKFLRDLEDGFVYIEFRDHSSPEAVASLKPFVNSLDGDARAHAEMLITLLHKDPVAQLLLMLDDPKRTDQYLIVSELARIGDARAIIPLAKVLRTAPDNFFNRRPILNSSLRNGYAVTNALRAISRPATAQSIHQLIELLPADLSRFGGYIKRKGCQRMIASHLIELTGESFGIDNNKWSAWEQKNRFD